ncbi:MAG: hypothetical protein KDN05_04725 [Verrucomicrobiae bacterium]|nr:hypothetical protein [Verrucomicrobiae bacterium]
MKHLIQSFRGRLIVTSSCLGLLSGVLHAQLPTPLINVDASSLAEGAVAAPIANTGSLGGTFGTDATTVNVATTSGKKSFTFDGVNRLKSDFTAPAGITGNGTYSVVATIYNPAVDWEEAYLTWAQRGTPYRVAQFNYGKHPTWGAITHWDTPDMGFIQVPAEGQWHVIAVTFDGSVERIYVNGVQDNSESKTLNHWPDQPFMIGSSYWNADGTSPAIPFSGSIASVQVYDDALSGAQVREASGVVLVTGQVTTGGDPVNRAAVSYATAPNPTASPAGTVFTDASGNYTLPVPVNAGTIYVAVAADGYATSADSEQTVAATDIGNVDFSVTLLPPLVDIDASTLTAGALTSLANAGSLGGNFSNDGTTVNVGTVDGKTAILFDGFNRMKSDFNAPATITGNSGFTVLALLHNPGIATEEAYLTWAQRGTFARCGQFNFGSSPDFGAAAHWGWPDIGFSPVPAANTWHWIAMTFDGATERIYVNGAANSFEAKTLDLWPDQPLMLGASYGNADGTGTGQNFSGSIASLKVYGGALTQSQITSLVGTVTISGNVNSGGTPIEGATVAYKLTPDALDSPLGTAVTDVDGNYSFGMSANTGTIYVAATKTGYFPSADFSPAPVVGVSNLTGIDFDLEPRPAVYGFVQTPDFDFLPNAAITLHTSPDGGTTLVPVQTVYSDGSGFYLAYVDKNTTYYLTAAKSTHSAGGTETVVVGELDELQDFTLTPLPRVLLVDLDASDLPPGVQTTATTWPNNGTLGGSFAASGDYLVSTVGGRPAVDFTGTPDLAFNSSFVTGDVPWPSSLANSGDIQYSVVGWIQAPASTGTFLSFSNGTAAVPNRTFNPSWMFFRYNNSVAWGAADHGFSHWVGWTGTNTNSPADFPATSTWHMIVHTYDGKSQKLYIDGVRKSTPGAEAIVRTFNPASNVMRLGLTNSNGDPFKGFIHRVQVFDQALADADVTQLWNEGSASGNDYDGWMALYPSITDPNDKLSTADPDGDGLTNQEEYAFGLAPDSGSSVNPILVQLSKTAGTFTYQRRSSTGLSYTVWTSPDVVNWTEDTTAVQTPGTPDANNVQSVVVTLSGAPLTADSLFVRVMAD